MKKSNAAFAVMFVAALLVSFAAGLAAFYVASRWWGQLAFVPAFLIAAVFGFVLVRKARAHE